MFVKHINENGIEILRECDSVAIRPLGEDAVMVTLAKREVELVSLEVEKENNRLYIMNDEGRTIDRYEWAYQGYAPVKAG